MKKNLLIAFCGMDGSGKTTLAKKLEEHLKKNGDHVFFKHAHGYAISQNSFAIDEENINSFKWIFALLSPFVLFDSWFTYFFKYKPILKKKTLICDRYFYDKIARLIYYGLMNKTMAKIYLKLIPRPNFIIFLDIDEKKARQRKKEYSKDEFCRFRKIYLFIAQHLKTPIINTNLSSPVCIKKIIGHLS